MSNRVCRDCRAIYNPQSTGARNGRCPTCARTADQARGTRTDRGYGPQHQALRTHWQQRINAGELVPCWRCADTDTPHLIRPGDTWHLGHDDHDRTITRGPECWQGNLSAAGRASQTPGGRG